MSRSRMLMLSCFHNSYSFHRSNFTLKVANKVVAAATHLSLPPLKNKAADVSPLLNGSSIFLLGFKTSLKTNFGKLLADVLRYYYYFDSDNLVEEAIGGASAAKSFRQSDEKGFYHSGTEVLKQLSSMDRLVVCTGNDAVQNSTNLALLRHGISLWIDVPLDIVARDVNEDQNQFSSFEISTSEGSYQEVVGELGALYNKCKGGFATADAIISLQMAVSFKTRKTAIAAVSAQPQKKKKERVFFLDVNPLCYEGSKPSLDSFARWLSLFFSQVTHTHPVIAVIDGERGSEHRRKLLPSYKAHRQKFIPHLSSLPNISGGHVGRFHQLIHDVLRKCNVPVIKVDGHEADDVVATLAEQALNKGFRVVIASPDKDFKQLISDDVQLVMPLPELKRWSFYTLRHYQDQYNCDPQSDLSLRCIIGDEVDGVPGIQHLVPSFGRKTALKLIKKHGSLESLLNASAERTVGRPYAQDALQKYADYLRRNYQVLALKRDVNVQLYDEWLVERDTHNDTIALSTLFKYLEERKELTHRS